jgi:hypothetical protein
MILTMEAVVRQDDELNELLVHRKRADAAIRRAS